MQHLYKPRLSPASKTVNSLVILTLDKDEKCVYHKELWNEKDYRKFPFLPFSLPCLPPSLRSKGGPGDKQKLVFPSRQCQSTVLWLTTCFRSRRPREDHEDAAVGSPAKDHEAREGSVRARLHPRIPLVNDTVGITGSRQASSSIAHSQCCRRGKIVRILHALGQGGYAWHAEH